MSGMTTIVGLRVEVSDLGAMCRNVEKSVLTGLRGACFVGGVGTPRGNSTWRCAAPATPILD